MALIHKLEKSIKNYKKHDLNMRRKGIGMMEENRREVIGRAESNLKKQSMAQRMG